MSDFANVRISHEGFADIVRLRQLAEAAEGRNAPATARKLRETLRSLSKNLRVLDDLLASDRLGDRLDRFSDRESLYLHTLRFRPEGWEWSHGRLVAFAVTWDGKAGSESSGRAVGFLKEDSFVLLAVGPDHDGVYARSQRRWQDLLAAA